MFTVMEFMIYDKVSFLIELTKSCSEIKFSWFNQNQITAESELVFKTGINSGWVDSYSKKKLFRNENTNFPKTLTVTDFFYKVSLKYRNKDVL